MICSKCGSSNIEGQTFCGSCGSPLNNTASAYERPQGNYQRPETSQPYRADTANPYGNPSNGGVIRPKSYLTEAIIVTIVTTLCCCNIISLILGIIAIVQANSVDSLFNAGNLGGAIKNADSAKTLTIWAAVVAVIFTVLGVLLYLLVPALFAGFMGPLGGLGL